LTLSIAPWSRLRVLCGATEWRINRGTHAFDPDSLKGINMIWETPTIEDIACGMEVTAYAPASEGEELNALPAVASTDEQAD
jgi:coenzyme PQQ precursor peptide PqqA